MVEKENNIISVKAEEMASFFLHCVPVDVRLTQFELNSMNMLPKLYGVLVFDFREYLQYLDSFYTKQDDSPIYINTNGSNRVAVYVQGVLLPSHAARLLYQNDTDKLKRLFLAEIGVMLALYVTSGETTSSFHIRWQGVSPTNYDVLKDDDDVLCTSPYLKFCNDKLPIGYSLIQRISLMRVTKQQPRVEDFNTPKGALALAAYARFASESRESYPLWDMRRNQPNP